MGQTHRTRPDDWRCGYTVVPKELTAATLTGERVHSCSLEPTPVHQVQRSFVHCSTCRRSHLHPEDKQEVRSIIDYYMTNAQLMREALQSTGLNVYGGVNAPYLWVQTPPGITSWRFFEQMLYQAQVVTTPGIGFGPSGEGYIRLTAFGRRKECLEAMNRIKTRL